MPVQLELPGLTTPHPPTLPPRGYAIVTAAPTRPPESAADVASDPGCPDQWVTDGGQPCPAPDRARQYTATARTAARLAETAADHAMHAACRAAGKQAARAEAAMHEAHQHALDAARHADHAALPGTPPGTVRSHAVNAVTAAEAAQRAAGIHVTAWPLRERLHEPTPPEVARQLAELSAVWDAEWEARERARTGMDADNRLHAQHALWVADRVVPDLMWARGHVTAMAAAVTGCLTVDDAAAWCGRRRVARHRVLELAAARHLAVALDGQVTVTFTGQVAYQLAVLAPQHINRTDGDAFTARLATIIGRMSRDDRRSRARRLPGLSAATARLYNRPVTLAEQATQAA